MIKKKKKNTFSKREKNRYGEADGSITRGGSLISLACRTLEEVGEDTWRSKKAL